MLVRVIDPQGRSLNLSYFDAGTPDRFRGVQFIDSPVGRFVYEYGSAAPKDAGLFDRRVLLANLTRVRLPTGYDPKTPAHPPRRPANSSGKIGGLTERRQVTSCLMPWKCKSLARAASKINLKTRDRSRVAWSSAATARSPPQNGKSRPALPLMACS